MMRKNTMFRKYIPSLLLFLLFELVAITLWIAKYNIFYLLNFSYIGGCLALGTALFTAKTKAPTHGLLSSPGEPGITKIRIEHFQSEENFHWPQNA